MLKKCEEMQRKIKRKQRPMFRTIQSARLKVYRVCLAEKDPRKCHQKKVALPTSSPSLRMNSVGRRFQDKDHEKMVSGQERNKNI